MTVFLIVAAVFLAGALLFVVPPLLSHGRSTRNLRSQVNAAVYRDQLRELESDLSTSTLAPDQYEKARRELETRVLEDVGEPDALQAAPAKGRWTAIVAAITVPALAIGLYVMVGTPQALSPEAIAARGGSPEVTERQIQEMVGRLAARLKEQPEDGEGWTMLGRSYTVLGRFDEAATAYRNAVERIPNNAQLLADYADALAMANGRQLLGEPEKLIARALAADPDNAKALALAGTVSFEKKDYAAAAAHWERILKGVPPDSEMGRAIASSVAEARSLAGGGAPVAQAPAEPAPAAAGKGMVSGTVTLAPQLAAKVSPTDTVFIYARAAEGPRMPLAIMRKPARELPAQFTLDDSMAMAPNMKLSSFDKVIVTARISKSGNAQPQPGDLNGTSGAIGSSATGIKVVIDSEVR